MSEGKLKIHSENILPIIKKWLYSDKDIFVRELVSNSCDAISKLLVLRDQEGIPVEGDMRIDIVIDKEAKQIRISDTGLGMTADEVEKYITQLAFSGAEEFLEKYKSSEEKEQIIGHFGLGFYSSFMISSLVEIETLSYQPESKPARWSCDGSSTYNLVEGTREARGTDIIMHVNEDEYLDSAKLRKILDTYCSFLPYPIYLEGQQINPKAPLWLKAPSECTDADYLDFYHQLHPSEPDPIFWIHLNVDHPFHLKGILYFPKITTRFDFGASHIKLYCNRVYVSDNCRDLFPDFLTILRGAIDSSDIPLNVSRSYLQMDSTVRKLESHISKKVSDKLSALHQSDREKFLSYWPDIEMIVKLGTLHDEKFYERAKPFLLWQNSNSEWTTIEEYLERHKEAYENKIFYTTQDKEHSPFLNLYKEKGIEVLYGGNPLDTAVMNQLESKLDCRFQRIDGAIDKLIIDDSREKEKLAADGRSEAANLASYIKEHLGKEGIEVEAKSLVSDSLPAFIMIDEGSRRMRDYFMMTQKETQKGFQFPLSQTFVVNTNNPLINSIAALKETSPALASSLVRHLYDLSLLSQRELQAEDLNAFTERSYEVLASLATTATATPAEALS